MSYLTHKYDEYARVVSTVIVTEKGIYKPDHVKEGVKSKLELEVVHRLILCDMTGRCIILDMEVEEAMDENDETGGPVRRDGNQIKSGEGPSGVPTEQKTKLNSALKEEQKTKAREFLQNRNDRSELDGTEVIEL